MNINIAICDDERVEIEYLTMLVRKWAYKGDYSVHISGFESAESFLFTYEEDKSFDLLLLDIQMKAIDGMELAKKIRKDNDVLQIIFITGLPDFVSEGYEVSALHYLMKPVKEEKLFEVLSKAITRMQATPRTFIFPRAGVSLRIKADDILYVEIFSHTITLYLRNGKEDFNMRIDDAAKLLGEGFFKCHRSYIVSLQHVQRVTRKSMLLDNGKEIPLSRSLYEDAIQAFIKYN